MSHSNSSATKLCVSVTWRSAWSFLLNIAEQYGQENFRSPACAEATCFLKRVAWTKVLAQTWHECCGLDSPGTQWVVRRWYRRPLSEKTLAPFSGQSGHLNRGLSWAHFMCCFKFELDLNTLGCIRLNLQIWKNVARWHFRPKRTKNVQNLWYLYCVS